MLTASPHQVTVTEQVYDLIFVDILNQNLQYESFEYIIYGENKKMLRKGQFRAPSVQIRTNHLQEGMYGFQLLLHGEEWNHLYFEKKAALC